MTMTTLYCFSFLEELKIIHEALLSGTLGLFLQVQGQISWPELAAKEFSIG